MIILDTVGVVVVIGDEGRPFKYAGACAAAETVGVETLAHRLQHTVCDPLSTSGTYCQGTLRRNRRKNKISHHGIFAVSTLFSTFYMLKYSLDNGSDPL